MIDLTKRLTKRTQDGTLYIGCDEMCAIWNICDRYKCKKEKIINKLGELEDLIDQGFLRIFPCQEGDHIFLVDFEECAYDEGIVEKIYIDSNGICVDSDYEIGTCVDSDYVFFSEEAAKQAIRDYYISK